MFRNTQLLTVTRVSRGARNPMSPSPVAGPSMTMCLSFNRVRAPRTLMSTEPTMTSGT